MTLYEIDRRIDDFLCYAEDMELSEDEIKDTLDSLMMDRTEKIDNIACYYKNLAAEAEAIKLEEVKLRDRRQAIDNKADRVKAYLDRALAGNRFESARVKVTYRKSEQVVVEDLEKLGKQFLRIKQTVEPNKGLIKEVIKTGAEVEGARLEVKNNISVK